MAEDERKRSSSRGISDRKVYEPRVATRRIESALLALGVITVVGVLGYMVLRTSENSEKAKFAEFPFHAAE